jgi:23S rRNA-/tRNA-specific pseudouridylate synthase/SAM-dependent methyltransferase
MRGGPSKRGPRPSEAGSGPLKPVRVPAPKSGEEGSKPDAPRPFKPRFEKGGFDKPRYGKPGYGKSSPFDRRPPKPMGFTRNLTVVHEDGDILIVDKPPGVITANMPGEDRESIFDQVKDHVKAGRRGRQPVKVWIIHRLDKEASGLLVFAKTEKAFHWLKEDFKAKRIKRLYSAVVEGRVGGSGPEKGESTSELPSGTIQSFIAEDEFGNTRSMGVGETAKNTGPEARRERWSGKAPRHPGEVPDKPQLAVTHYRVLAVGNGRSLVQLRLETGRKNQIRLHMKEMGHPIVGDRRFGATTDPIQRVALHATDLGFTHPTSGAPVRYMSPTPPSFSRAIGQEPVVAPKTEPPPSKKPSRAVDTSWDDVALWYDQLVEEGRSDHFDQVIVPGTLRLLHPLAGMRVLDVACGQGHLCRKLAELGLDAVGVDASPRLIDAARSRAEGLSIRYDIGDARSLDAAALGAPFDSATCIMALMNIEPVEPVLKGIAAALKPGGSLVIVILHPAFRAPGQTAWGWDEGGKRDESRQFRRVDGYLSPGQVPITMNPGYAAHGAETVQTWTFHRPLQTYFKSLSDAGFVVETLEEWPSQRTSQAGPRAAEENRARREIPMFLGFRAIKRAE